MSVNLGLLADYSTIYPDSKETIDELTNGIPKTLILKAAPTFLAYELLDRKDNSWRAIATFWFRSENRDFVEDLQNRIEKHYGAEESEVQIFSAISSLKLLQHGFEKVESDFKKSEEQTEIDLFKIYLLLNESFTSLQTRSAGYIEKSYPKTAPSLTLLNMGFSTSDLTNYIQAREFFCQSVKALFFFAYLKSEQALDTHQDAFLKKYGITSMEDYYARVLPFIQHMAKKEKEGFIEIQIENNEDYQINRKFIDNLSIEEYAKEDDIDFRTVRSKPLVQVGKDLFRITHPLFFTDKLYKSLYFEYSKINEDIKDKNKIKGFRSFYTTNFSEKFLLYEVIRYGLKKRYVQFNGEELEKLGVKGAPDYYVRNGKEVFLIENKDILIKAEVKENPLFEDLEAELKKKFLEEEGRGVGIKQIVNNIERVLTLKNPFDTKYTPSKTIVYPVLVVHDIVYDCPGLNQLFNEWFLNELKTLEQKGIDTKNVKPLIVLNIDTLIRSAELLRSGNISFRDMIEVYYKNLVVRRKVFESELEMKKEITRTYLPSTKVIENWLEDNHSVLLRYNKILEHAYDKLKSKVTL